jgi:hypothetical protein
MNVPSQTKAHAASLSSPLELVGLYYSPSDVASSTRSELSPTTTKLAQSIASNLGKQAVVLQVRTQKYCYCCISLLTDAYSSVSRSITHY